MRQPYEDRQTYADVYCLAGHMTRGWMLCASSSDSSAAAQMVVGNLQDRELGILWRGTR